MQHPPTVSGPGICRFATGFRVSRQCGPAATCFSAGNRSESQTPQKLRSEVMPEAEDDNAIDCLMGWRWIVPRLLSPLAVRPNLKDPHSWVIQQDVSSRAATLTV